MSPWALCLAGALIQRKCPLLKGFPAKNVPLAGKFEIALDGGEGRGVNLKKLAQELGLSQTTVSRALNGYPEVSEKTRKRVADAADRLGYRPNVSARRLATGRVGAVGIVMPSEGPLLVNPHFSEFLAGLGQRLAADEIDVMLSVRGDELAGYRRIAADKGVDAMIISTPKPEDERVTLCTKLGLPFIVHGRTRLALPHAWLDIDNEGAMFAATMHLLDLGHRRIALGNGPSGLMFCELRELGWKRALMGRGIVPDARLTVGGEMTDEMGFRFGREMLTLRPRPTAFVCGSITMALGVFRAIRAEGLELGRDISMIAHDDVFPYLNADKMFPTMSTTRSSIREAGNRIAELVIEMLAGRDPGTIHEEWPIELIARGSTGPAPKTA
jgi:LacI family transcriptional regulator